MDHVIKIIAVVGSYRKGGNVDAAIDEMLASARELGAEAEKIYLIDKEIEFCRNCRQCTQQRGPERGICLADDDMCGILDTIEAADALIIGSPVNFSTVTAVTKRFIERLICFAYWPWGSPSPAPRARKQQKPGVALAASASPALMARVFTQQRKLLKQAAGLMGFDIIGTLFIGYAAIQQTPHLSPRARKKARRLGRKLILRAQSARTGK